MKTKNILLGVLVLVLLSANSFALKTVGIEFLQKNEVYRIDVDQANIAMTSVKFTVKKEAPFANVTVQYITQNSAPVKLRDAYKYFRIASSGIDDKEGIETARIEFKVDSSWFRLQEYRQDAVKLNVFDNGQWVELETKPSGVVSGELYFTAESYMFGYFAITSQKIEEEIVSEAENVTVAVKPDVTREEIVYQAPPKLTWQACIDAVPKQLFYLASGLVGALIVFVVAYAVLGIEKHPYPELTGYVKKSLRKGADVYEIRKVLLSAGWPADLVDKELKLK